jgi:adenylate kinase
MNILLIGPQGSGKSSQAKLLAERLGVPYLSTGEIFRQMAKEKTALGRKIRTLLQKGILVDDEPTIKIVKEYFKKSEFKHGFVAEGFPRNLYQAKRLKKFFDKVFYLSISREEIMRRLMARRVCQRCKANFNILTHPPQKEGICDKCGSKLIQREDDKEEAIKKRLEIYFRQTQPVLDFFRHQGILEEVDGERPIEAILEDLLSRL